MYRNQSLHVKKQTNHFVLLLDSVNRTQDVACKKSDVSFTLGVCVIIQDKQLGPAGEI